jgi:hypothetical protein
MSKDAGAVKSMTKDATLAEDAIKSMAKDFVEVGGKESTNVGAGNKVMGDTVNVKQAALRMGDVVGAEYEHAPTVKRCRSMRTGCSKHACGWLQSTNQY